MKPLLVVNLDKCAPGTAQYLGYLGYDHIAAEGQDVPAVQSVPTKEDCRFTAAVAAMQGLAGRISTGELAGTAVQVADALLEELSKDG